MSEPKPLDLLEVILEEADSKWVRWEDYARLKSEVERLRKGDERDMTAAYLYAAEQSKDEIKRLKAEVERLTAFTTRTIIPNEELQIDLENCRIALRVKYEEVANLKAEVERLTKAGDVMAGVIGLPVNSVQSSALIENWNAAKER